MVDPSVVNLANLNDHVYTHIWKTYILLWNGGSIFLCSLVIYHQDKIHILDSIRQHIIMV